MPETPPPSLLNLIIVEAAAEPYMDLAGICRLKRKCDGVDEHKTPFLPWPIQSRQIEAWIAKLYFDKTNKFVSRTELADTMLVLEGIAQERRQLKPHLADVIEQDQLLATLLSFLATDNSSSSDTKQRTWSGTATDLYKKVQDQAFTLRLAPEQMKTWPTDPARLSSRLRELTPWLKKAGITYSYARTGKQRTHSFVVSTDTDTDIVDFVKRVNAKAVIPIHTFEPEKFSAVMDNVRPLADGESINL